MGNKNSDYVLSIEADNARREIKVCLFKGNLQIVLDETEAVFLANALTCQIRDWKKS